MRSKSHLLTHDLKGCQLQIFSATLRGWVNPADAFILLHEGHENAFWLDRENHPSQAFSVIGAGAQLVEGQVLDELHGQFQMNLEINDDLELPFDWRPGLVGFVEFEGSYRFLSIDRAMVFDHVSRHMYFVGAFETKAAFDQWHHAGLLRLGLAGGQVAQYLERTDKKPAQTSDAVLRHSPAEYLDLIEDAQRAISTGDVYQLCLTNQLRFRTQADPLSIFLKLRKTHSAPYAAYLQFGDTAIASISPEQFLKVSRDGRLSSKPIKGTRPRSENFEQDDAIANELLNNSKERAENLMIVDLMRNDFSIVSEAESVTVSRLFDIESYSTVHQLVSTVEGQLSADATAIDALAACFPGGSMTGAPKPKAIQLIREFENDRRGIYSGVLGYLGSDGSAEFGMVIRSLIFEMSDDVYEVSLGIGGGITIDSDPTAELEETKLKAQALLSALNATDPWA